MARGDHIKVKDFGYSHHGVDCGDGTVIHFAGHASQKRNPEIRRVTFDDFARGRRVFVVKHTYPLQPEEVIWRAESLIGTRDYDLLFNNCEHFAAWCVTGRRVSRQVSRGFGVAAAGMASAFGTGGVLALRTAYRLMRGTQRARRGMAS
jgi:hypothetical protein